MPVLCVYLATTCPSVDVSLAGSHSLISIYKMDWSTSLSTSASSSSSGKRSAVCDPKGHSNRQRLSRVSEAAPLMLSNFPPPRSYGSLLTYYRFLRNGSVTSNTQVQHVTHVTSSLSHEQVCSIRYYCLLRARN
jgi:hypothetical protein